MLRTKLTHQDFVNQFLISCFLSLGILFVLFNLFESLSSIFVTLPDLEQLGLLIVESERGGLNPEPFERFAYLACVIALLPVVMCSIKFTNFLFQKRNTSQQAVMSRLSAVILMIIICFYIYIGFFSNLASYLTGVSLLSTTTPFLIACSKAFWVIATLIAVFMLNIAFTEASINKHHHFLGNYARFKSTYIAYINGLIIFCGLLVIAVLRVRTAEVIYKDQHFEAVFYAVTQVMTGKTLLHDLPAQYGLYAELLKPIFMISGLSVFKFTLLMSIMQGAAFLAAISAVSKLVQNVYLRGLGFISLVWIIGSTYLLAQTSFIGHEYFQIWPIRFFFPAISFWCFTSLVQSGITTRKLIYFAILAGVAVLWNLDSGIPIWGGAIAFFILKLLFDNTDKRIIAKQLAIISVVPCIVITLFLVYLRVKAGAEIDFSEWVKYQKIFYLTGFGMLPIPHQIDSWNGVIGIYIFGIVAGVMYHANGLRSSVSDSIFYLSIMGVGLFTYYQGRSHDIVLSFVLWPAIIISICFADSVLRKSRAGSIPVKYVYTIAPVIILSLVIAMKCLLHAPALTRMIYQEAYMLYKHSDDSEFHSNLAFLKGKLQKSTSVVIIDPGQSVFFGELGLASAIPGPGMIEMLLVEDRAEYIANILNGAEPNVFIKVLSNDSIPEPYLPLLQKYHVTSISQYGLAALKRNEIMY